ncbi:MAG TPA: FtsX-like permease family protein [Vicinamibacterales bacterium]|nr:FtsX-like permease family protein [Vicinamibacterales bacterium]
MIAADARRMYRALLRLLPRAFRAEAEPELLEVFDAGYARIIGGSRIARIRFWTLTLCDLLLTAVAERAPFRRSARVSVRTLFMGLTHDVRYAARTLIYRPGWTGLNAGTLAVGLAATIVASVLVRNVLLAPLPFPESEQLVRLREVSDDGGRWWPSFPNARDWRDQAGSVFRGVGIADVPRVRVVMLDGTGLRVSVSRAAGGLFETLGVHPLAGRLFSADENKPGGPPAAIVSEAFWRGPLAARPLEDLHIGVGDTQYAIVGVLPASFRFLGDGAAWTTPADVWTPMERDSDLGMRTSHGYHVVARLRTGMTVDRARTEMNALAARLKRQIHEPTQADAVEIRPLQDFVVARVRDPLRWLLYASLAVLLVACLDLAASILAQGLDRTRELSIRIALGASPLRLVRHLLIQATALALPAVVVGLALAVGALACIRAEAAATLPRLDEVVFDARAGALAVFIALGAALLAGILPAGVLASHRFTERLRVRGAGAAIGSRRLWPALIVTQVALSMLLLVGAGLLLRSFVAAVNVDLGYDAARVIAVDISLPEVAYAEPARRIEFYDRALERLRANPAVTAAGLTSVLPHETSAMTAPTFRDSANARSIFAAYRLVDDGYFEAAGIPQVQMDRTAFRAGGALVDRTLQRVLWKGRNPQGDRVQNNFSDRVLTVAGVVGSVREWNQDAETTGAVYVDFHSRPAATGAMHLLVRYSGTEQAAAKAIRQAIASTDPIVPIAMAPLQERVTAGLADRRFLLILASGFGAVALVLASVGVYALVAFGVARRLRESAIRLALGAPPSTVRTGALSVGLLPAAVGVSIALLASVWLGRALRSQLFHVNAVDPLVLTCAAIAAIAAAWVAAALPARRAARVDPADILRMD